MAADHFDILAKIKQLSEAEKCMISEIITLCKLLVNPATSAAGERETENVVAFNDGTDKI